MPAGREGRGPVAEALSISRSVGRIHGTAKGSAIGTGFLFDGGLIHEAYQSLPLFLTCNHCISGLGKRNSWAVPWSDGAVVFQQMQTEPSVKGEAAFLQALTESPYSELNYTLLLLDRWPGSVTDLRVAPRKPQPAAEDRVFVISDPLGGGLAVSLDDNIVVEAPHAEASTYQPRPETTVHYSAPTEVGSSGAPVFNEHWEIVAIHIGGGTHANYGVSMDAVIEDAGNKLQGFSVPQKIRDLIDQKKTAASPKVLKESAGYFSVFISYRHADAAFARRLFNAFESQGVRAWLDEKRMLPGQFIDEAEQTGIQESDKFVLCCSKASLESSWWVDSEIAQIFEKERELSRAAGRKLSVVIPVILDNYLTDEWKGAKAAELRSRHGTDFRDWQDEKRFGESFKTLLLALRPSAP